MSTTLFGRRRYVPELRNPQQERQKLRGEDRVWHARDAGTAADIM